MRELAYKLAEKRQLLAELKEEYGRRLAAFEEANQSLMDSIKDQEWEVTDVEGALRKAAIDEYKKSPWNSKQMGHGIVIKEMVDLEYDPKDALEWALNVRAAVKLDEAVFKKAARALKLPFVTERTHLVATLPRSNEKLRE